MIYKLIQNWDPQVVVDRVNLEMKDGWRPLGGIAISAWFQPGAPGAVERYSQALVKGE